MYLAKPPGYNLRNFALPFSVIDESGLFWNANEIDIALITFPKICKNTHGWLELLMSIFPCI